MIATDVVSTAAVREYILLNSTPSTSKYSDSTLGSNIRAAVWTLERATGRRFMDRTETLTFTTNGEAYIAIPGLRTASAVSRQGAELTADSTYWLIPDAQHTGVSVAVQVRAFTNREDGPWYLSNPEWFDRNLDSTYWRRHGREGSLPNDLSVAGTWGYTDGSMPEPFRHAAKVLAAYYTKRPDAILSGSLTTPDGNFVNLSTIPVEVRQFVEEWRIGGRQAVGL